MTMFTNDLKNIMNTKAYIWIVFVAFCTCLPGTALATEKDLSEDPEQPVIAVTDQETDPFEYVLEGRPDPFLPFIQPKVAATKLNLDEIVEDEITLTGMQLFEPGQLTLVAVLLAGESKIAMVEDVTGKGYVINQGMLIGRNGTVSQITKDNDVIITETARTRAGKELITTVVMRLNKEGDQ